MPLPSRWERAVKRTWRWHPLCSCWLVGELQGVEGGGKHWAYETLDQALKALADYGSEGYRVPVI